ncbi:Vitamin B6 transporter [Friedmanniomyces endolithicus]|nr:Vitamin B6 transporter [Friedmanniomyces endolithicus]
MDPEREAGSRRQEDHDTEMLNRRPPVPDFGKDSSQEPASLPNDDAPRAANDRADGGTSKLAKSWRAFERALVRYNFEARGIQRVLPDQRHDMRQLGLMQILLLWFSINLAANNLTLGMLGPTVFYLPFLDSSLCAVFGALLGSLPVAYIATFGPRSGNRTMVFARYSMGWWPAKLVVVLTLIVLLGYCILDAVIAGQILSAVSANGDLSVVVGIVITAVITWLVTVFGYSIFHWYERWAWLPQLVVILVLAGVAGKRFDLHADPSAGLDGRTITGNRLSFFSLCYSAAVTYSCAGADYFVYYPEATSKWTVFSVTVIGLVTSFTLEFVIGIGLASGIASNPSWTDAYGVSQGALAVEGFRPLGAFGSFLSVILALGLVANLVAPTYSSGVDFQVLGRVFERVPRVVWNTVGVAIYTVCAIAGREHLAAIFTNFLALMGYWVSIWIAIVLEEHLIFRKWRQVGWNWDAWNDRRKLPVGIAALVAFLVGWAGAILCMAQVWYIGPLAALVGEYGGDMGNYVGFTWAGLVYPPLRWLELRKFGR